MVARNDARRQKKLAKQKAKRSEKRAREHRRDSKDPTIRLQGVEKWPVVEALVGSKLWQDGIGYLVIARQEGEGRLVYGVYLVDVFCLGVKNAFWGAGSVADFKDLIQKMVKAQKMLPISPACLVKIIGGAVEYAGSFDFPPHPDYRHAARVLAGIDPAGCDEEFTFGKDGNPLYIQGPYESPAVADAIRERIEQAGGHFIVMVPDFDDEELGMFDDAQFDPDAFDSDNSVDEET